MSNNSDFKSSDSSELIINDNNKPVRANTRPTDITLRRKEAIKEYYGGKDSLLQKIKNNPNGTSIEAIFDLLVEEFANESDGLLGNSVLFLKDNMLQESSVVSVKRAEVLEKLSSLLSKKADLVKNSGEVNLNSIVFKIFIQLCFEKMAFVLEELNIPIEQRQLIVGKWSNSMENWDKEVQIKMEQLNNE